MLGRTRLGPSHDRIFFAAAGLWLFLANFIGFAPSFFLREQFDVFDEPLPANQIAHGVLNSLWITLFLTQTVLISTNRIALHKIIGIAALVTMLFIPLIGFHVVLAKTAAGLKSVDGAGFNLTELFLAFILAVIGFAKRGSPFFHKRLMLSATAMLSVAAADRIAFILDLGDLRIFRKLLAAAPLLALVAYDGFLMRRPPLFALFLFALFWSVTWFVVSDLIFTRPIGEAVIAALSAIFLN